MPLRLYGAQNISFILNVFFIQEVENSMFMHINKNGNKYENIFTGIFLFTACGQNVRGHEYWLHIYAMCMIGSTVAL